MKPQPLSDAEIASALGTDQDSPVFVAFKAIAVASIAARDAQWAAMIGEPVPLTDDAIERAYNEAWRSLPSDFGHTSGDWFEAGARYAAAEVARAVAAERERLAEVVRDMYREAKAELQDEDQNTWYDGYCDGLEAASNRLRADPQRLQGKGECR